MTREHSSYSKKLVVCALTALMAMIDGGCAATAPRILTSAKIAESDSRAASDYVTYREITREDFQAANSPAESREEMKRVGALLCGAIVPDSKIVLAIESAVHPVGTEATNARADGTWFTMRGPEYRAKMDRACSWWNDEQATVPAEYVLEHEQIHFALIEIYAQEINRDLGALRIRVDSREHAHEAANTSANRLLERATQRLVEESRRFDDQTSPAVDREAQRRWKHDVERRLRDSA